MNVHIFFYSDGFISLDTFAAHENLKFKYSLSDNNDEAS
jgi:hypothetical protein